MRDDQPVTELQVYLVEFGLSDRCNEIQIQYELVMAQTQAGAVRTIQAIYGDRITYCRAKPPLVEQAHTTPHETRFYFEGEDTPEEDEAWKDL